MLLAHCEGIVVGTIRLYLVPLACLVYFPLELETEILNISRIIHGRYVHPDFKWSLEMQSFILDRHVPRNRQVQSSRLAIVYPVKNILS